MIAVIEEWKRQYVGKKKTQFSVVGGGAGVVLACGSWELMHDLELIVTINPASTLTSQLN